MEKYIVAEIHKNWTKDTPVNDLISQRFEVVINTNHDRGYKLTDWRLTITVNEQLVTETIIAVFELQ